MIIIGELQIPARKFQSLEEAQEERKVDQMVVKDQEDIYWVIDEENFPKIESYGYEAVTI
ncbi:hypothetical protein [Salsuginibacillus kocurii]|uniref:hypothetical protein n=1 Tax=Salsuginibacillus kocurii TaxID=427078 RepID=UPI00036BDBA8|nr:hypothetical protein [Salsuginibacillus kocurii]